MTRTRTTSAHPAAPRTRIRRTVAASVALLLPLALSFGILGTPSAEAISRDDVLARAQQRVDAPVRYSQARHYAGYRTDCSGYVSMTWATGTSWSTRSLHNVSHRISVSQLKPGDALLKKGYHVRLFYGWLDDAHTQYVSYESADGWIAGCRIHSIANDLDFGYVPVRYDRIRNSPTPHNLLKNGAFDTWAGSWGGRPDQPVWWQTGQVRPQADQGRWQGDRGSWHTDDAWSQTLVTRRTDTYRTARSALELVNPSADPAVYSELSQTTRVVAGADYRVKAWAKTAFDARGVELKIAYLNALGESVAETAVAGDFSTLNASAFRPMSIVTSTPSDAVRARVTVRLAGGGTTDASGTVTPGTSVFLDDISLTRPQVTVSVKASAATARRGSRVVLSGKVTPTSALGAPAMLYVKRPGSAWKQLSTSTVGASDGGARWTDGVTFTRGMPRGTYQFKAKVPAVDGYTSGTTSVVSVKLR